MRYSLRTTFGCGVSHEKSSEVRRVDSSTKRSCSFSGRGVPGWLAASGRGVPGLAVVFVLLGGGVELVCFRAPRGEGVECADLTLCYIVDVVIISSVGVISSVIAAR